MEEKIIFPGAQVGIIGDSPNGIMLCEAAKNLGFTTIGYSPDGNSPLLSNADVRIVGAFHDLEKLKEFGERCDLIIYDTINIAAEIVEYLALYAYLPQKSEGLVFAQDRLLERTFLEQLNINIAPYATIVNLEDVYQAVSSIGFPCVLKPIQKGFFINRTRIIEKQSDIASCEDIVEMGTYILESLVPAKQELTLVVACDREKTVQMFPVVEDHFHNYKLQQVKTPAIVDKSMLAEMKRITNEIVQNLDYIGILQVSFSLTDTDALYVKRVVSALGPEGYVFDKATNVSMFEQHLRALCGMPLVEVKLTTPAIMGLLQTDQMDAIRAQWVLKNNWFYRFYRYPKATNEKRLGYVVITDENLENAQNQVDATNIWE